MRAAWLVLASLLGGCQADADTLEQAVSAKKVLRVSIRIGKKWRSCERAPY